jgi:hypothetical protein
MRGTKLAASSAQFSETDPFLCMDAVPSIRRNCPAAESYAKSVNGFVLDALHDLVDDGKGHDKTFSRLDENTQSVR